MATLEADLQQLRTEVRQIKCNLYVRQVLVFIVIYASIVRVSILHVFNISGKHIANNHIFHLVTLFRSFFTFSQIIQQSIVKLSFFH